MAEQKVKKAVFLVAGFGTRFLPISKAVPKHMLPIVDKPILQYLVEEAVEAGIEDIIFVTGRGKNAIEDHFDSSYELEQTLIGKGKTKLLEQMENISKLANFAYTRQAIPKGDGDALMHAMPFINNEPVLVIFPDYMMPYENHTFKRMVDYYEKTGKSIIAVDEIAMEKTDQFGVIAYEATGQGDIVKVNRFVEKPAKGTAPSNMINLGHAIITPEILNQIKENSESTVPDGEIRIADTYTKIIEEGGDLFALKPLKQGFDCGNATGYLKANIYMGLHREDTKEELWDYLKELLKREEMRSELVNLLQEGVEVLNSR